MKKVMFVVVMLAVTIKAYAHPVDQIYLQHPEYYPQYNLEAADGFKEVFTEYIHWKRKLQDEITDLTAACTEARVRSKKPPKKVLELLDTWRNYFNQPKHTDPVAMNICADFALADNRVPFCRAHADAAMGAWMGAEKDKKYCLKLVKKLKK